jgi:hypothetical protein
MWEPAERGWDVLYRTEQPDGVAYQAEVKQTESADGACEWRVWRFNPKQTISIGHIANEVHAKGRAKSRDEANRSAIATLRRLTGEG